MPDIFSDFFHKKVKIFLRKKKKFSDKFSKKKTYYVAKKKQDYNWYWSSDYDSRKREGWK